MLGPIFSLFLCLFFYAGVSGAQEGEGQSKSDLEKLLDDTSHHTQHLRYMLEELVRMEKAGHFREEATDSIADNPESESSDKIEENDGT